MGDIINGKLMQINNVNKFEKPYKHFSLDNPFKPQDADKILRWLETTNMFTSRKERLLRSSSFFLSAENIPSEVADFFSNQNLISLKKDIENIFNIEFKDYFTVSANKFVLGEGALIHTDYIDPESKSEIYFTHRFLLYFNRGWVETDGGSLGIFNSSDQNDLEKTINPIHNTAIGFAINPHSYHAVSAIKNGIRFTLNFSFTSKNGLHQI